MNNPPRSFRFSVRMLYWATALIAVVFGFFATPFNVIIFFELPVVYFLLWACPRTRSQTLATLVYLAMLQFVCSLTYLGVSTPSTVARSNSSRNNLKYITIVIHSYSSVQSPKSFPPPFTTNKEGEKLHSWRSIILPHHYPRLDTILKQINYKLPWDAKENNHLASSETYIYSSPSTNLVINGIQPCAYLAIVDEQTVWHPESPRLLSEITDDPGDTIILLEYLSSNIAWPEPRDLTLDEAIDILTKPKINTGTQSVELEYFRKVFTDPYTDYHHIAFADGNVESIPPIKDPAIARALLTCNGGEDLSNWRESLEKPILEYSWTAILIRCLQLALFIAVATYPYWQKQPPPTTSPANLSEGE